MPKSQWERENLSDIMLFPRLCFQHFLLQLLTYFSYLKVTATRKLQLLESCDPLDLLILQVTGAATFETLQ